MSVGPDVYYPCPTCGLPAIVTDHWTMPSTQGPVTHVRIQCWAGHDYTPPADQLARAQDPVPL